MNTIKAKAHLEHRYMKLSLETGAEFVGYDRLVSFSHDEKTAKIYAVDGRVFEITNLVEDVENHDFSIFSLRKKMFENEEVREAAFVDMEDTYVTLTHWYGGTERMPYSSMISLLEVDEKGYFYTIDGRKIEIANFSTPKEGYEFDKKEFAEVICEEEDYYEEDETEG